MPTRRITIDGRSWDVFPSGWITANEHDEFGLMFISGSGPEREVRVTRYSPQGVRSREQSLAEMGDDRLLELLRASQPSETSPEAGYRTSTLPGDDA